MLQRLAPDWPTKVSEFEFCYGQDFSSILVVEDDSRADSIRSQVMRDVWWTERHWGSFLQVLPFNLPLISATTCSTIITIYHPGLVQ
jgi:hypothetical protein